VLPISSAAALSPSGSAPRRLWDRQGRRFFLVTWLLLSALTAAWALATPLFASPDEPGQVIKAAAVVRGQLTGETIEQPGHYFEIITGVEAPAYYIDAFDATACFIDDPREAADCAPAFRADDTSSAPMTTWIGRYPPTYYFLAGLPSLVVDGDVAVLCMRMLSAVLCSALFALGLTSLRCTARPTAMLSAGLLALTPTALFFAGVVNSSGLEIASGFATWAVLLPLVTDPGAHRMGPRLLLGAAAATVLLITRPGSPLLAALIAGCLAVVAARSFWREAFRARSWLAPVLVASLGAMAALAWLLLVEPTDSLGGSPDPALADPVAAMAGAWELTPRYAREQLAVFGLLNLPAHPLILWGLGLTILALVTAGMIVGRGRLRLGLALGALVVAGLPVVAQVPTAADLGLIWQGRYGLPFSIGLPLLAMTAVISRERGAALATRFAPVLVGVATVGHIGSFAWSAWRYSWGFDQRPLADPVEWQPPVSVVPLVVGFAVVALALGVAVLQQRDSPLRRVLGRAPHPVPAEPATGTSTA
jgi:hypothetical protein